MKLKFIRKHTESGNAVSFIFEPDQPIEWVAGQYLTITMPDVPIGNNERTFTISSAPYEKNITITTRVTDSDFKQRMNRLEPGEVIEADQLGGDFVWVKDERPKVLVAGGIGITPFRSMLKQLHEENETFVATLIYNNRDDNIVFQAELDQIDKIHPEFGIHYIIGERLSGQVIADVAPRLMESLVYISGPEPMVDALEKQLIELGLPKDQLKQDWFPRYTEETY